MADEVKCPHVAKTKTPELRQYNNEYYIVRACQYCLKDFEMLLIDLGIISGRLVTTVECTHVTDDIESVYYGHEGKWYLLKACSTCLGDVPSLLIDRGLLSKPDPVLRPLKSHELAEILLKGENLPIKIGTDELVVYTEYTSDTEYNQHDILTVGKSRQAIVLSDDAYHPVKNRYYEAIYD